jgi:hypothetical protein
MAEGLRPDRVAHPAETIGRYRRSSLGRQAFCQQQGIGRCGLKNWLYKASDRQAVE